MRSVRKINFLGQLQEGMEGHQKHRDAPGGWLERSPKRNSERGMLSWEAPHLTKLLLLRPGPWLIYLSQRWWGQKMELGWWKQVPGDRDTSLKLIPPDSSLSLARGPTSSEQVPVTTV